MHRDILQNKEINRGKSDAFNRRITYKKKKLQLHHYDMLLVKKKRIEKKKESTYKNLHLNYRGCYTTHQKDNKGTYTVGVIIVFLLSYF